MSLSKDFKYKDKLIKRITFLDNNAKNPSANIEPNEKYLFMKSKKLARLFQKQKVEEKKNFLRRRR